MYGFTPLAISTLLLTLVCSIAASADEPITVRPERIEEKLTNPHMGFIYYGGLLHPEVADVYYTSALTWGELEPEEGKYVWDLNAPPWANAKAALERGKRVAIRVMPSFQGHPYATPKWVHDLGVGRYPAAEIQEQHGQSDLYEPEWWNSIYVEKYCAFIRALGKELDGKPWLDWVDMRYYGFWGEGHRFSADVPWPEEISKRDTLIRFIDAHLKAFRETPVVVQMAEDENTPYPEGTAIDYALSKGAWMRRDGFGPYISKRETDLMQRHWTTSLLVAENGGSYSDFAAGKIRKFWVPDSPTITLEDCIEQMLTLHCNYIPLGWGDQDWPVLEQRPELLKKLWMKMGYRLVLEEMTLPRRIAPGQAISITHRWSNAGVGRLPKAYPLVFELVNEKGARHRLLLDTAFDQTAWFEGKSHTFRHVMKVPSDLTAGAYRFAVSLVSPETGEPAIALGIAGETGGLRYQIAEIGIAG